MFLFFLFISFLFFLFINVLPPPLFYYSYIIKAPLTIDGLRDTIAYLEDENFIDKQTAMFDVIMTAYNYNLDLYIEYVIVKK